MAIKQLRLLSEDRRSIERCHKIHILVISIEEQQQQDHRVENMSGYDEHTNTSPAASQAYEIHDRQDSSDAVEDVYRFAVEDVNRFDELNIGYYTNEGSYIKMNEPRGCYYNKQEYKKNLGLFIYTGKHFGGPAYKDVKLPIGKPIPRQKSPDITPMDVEMRGITFAQLLAVKVNMEKRCVKEGWISTNPEDNETLLTPDKVTLLYDLNKYTIIPYTKDSKSSFVETLPSTAGTQPPKFFVGHTWGERFYHTLDCIKQMIKDFKDNHYHDPSDNQRGGGMTEHTPIWIYAFANNQHDLDQAITADPSESGFAKAMEVANYRTISILDKDGIVFERIWCVYEFLISYLNPCPREERQWCAFGLEWALGYLYRA